MSVTRRVGFVDDVVRHSYDDDGVVSVNTGGITSFSAGVDGDDTVVADTDVSVVNKRIAVDIHLYIPYLHLGSLGGLVCI